MKRSSLAIVSVVTLSVALYAAVAMASNGAAKKDQYKPGSNVYQAQLTPDQIKKCQKYLNLGAEATLTSDQLTQCSQAGITKHK